MDLISALNDWDRPLGSSWIEKTRIQTGVDLMGVLAVDGYSHPDFLYGVKAFLPSAKACVIFFQALQRQF